MSPFLKIENNLSYQDVSVILGDMILLNENVKYYLVDKFLFLKIIKNVILLGFFFQFLSNNFLYLKNAAIQNLIGYLCEASSRKPLYYEVKSDFFFFKCYKTKIKIKEIN